jgi:V8-like Glu-specific endopeptidase
LRSAKRSAASFFLVAAREATVVTLRPVLKGGATALAAGICTLAATAVAAPRHLRTPGADLTAQIVNGVVTTDYAATGALLDGANGSAASVTCTGTLIGCGKFLTAGHCVDGSFDPAEYTVFFQHAASRASRAIPPMRFRSPTSRC